MTDVSVGFRPPCWCPSGWAPAWRLHTNLYKFGWNISSDISYTKYSSDLNLGEGLILYLLPLSSQILDFIQRFWFWFWSILNGVTLKTSNTCVVPTNRQNSNATLEKFQSMYTEYTWACECIWAIPCRRFFSLTKRGSSETVKIQYWKRLVSVYNN